MNGNILIIDDELTVCKSCQKILTGDGYHVSIALNGFRGLEGAMKEDFDLVIVDLKMPDIDGMEVVEIIKRARPDTAVIIMTSYSTVPSAVEGMSLGAADYIPKPFTPDEMHMAVKKALQQKNRQEQKANAEDAGVLINKEAIIEVFTRIAEDKEFVGRLPDSDSKMPEEDNLTPMAVEEISNYPDISEKDMSDVATFSSPFRFEPSGEHRVRVCQGTACHVKGSKCIMDKVSKCLGIKTGETTPDYRFSLEKEACVGSCALSPVVVIDEKVYGRMTPQKVKRILTKTKK